MPNTFCSDHLLSFLNLDRGSQVPHRGAVRFGGRDGWSSDSQHKEPRAASGSSSGLSGYLQDCLHGPWSFAAGGSQGVRGENQPAPLWELEKHP